MPEVPTPGVNGHVVSSPALHASMSRSSLAPATRVWLLLGSTASAGSFCLFSENGEVAPPTVGNWVSGFNASASGTATKAAATTPAKSTFGFLSTLLITPLSSLNGRIIAEPLFASDQ